jgi:EAL domain-containing protein (putative c-di-GMP-specific phosphodiesterase class I)
VSWHEAVRPATNDTYNIDPASISRTAGYIAFSMFSTSTGDACGLNGDSLELEITESTVMSRAHEVGALMTEIRALGISLSIDDFGTGYSSLAHLKQFPVQRLKIDRSFIQDLGRDEESTAIVRSIVELGHGLKLRVLAEGVETAEQLDMLRQMACDEYQGYLFSCPVPSAAVPSLLRENWLLP